MTDSDELQDEEDEQPEAFNAGSWPSLTVDGESKYLEPDDSDDYRIQVEYDAVANGYVSDDDGAWLNSASLNFRRETDFQGQHPIEECTVTISVGDPRGAFAMTVSRHPDGSMRLSVPNPSDSMPHMDLSEIRPGFYEIK